MTGAIPYCYNEELFDWICGPNFADGRAFASSAKIDPSKKPPSFVDDDKSETISHRTVC